MEDDDEFGDLYTDVLRPFSSQLSSSSAPNSPMDPDPKSASRDDSLLGRSPPIPSKTLALSLNPTRKEQSREGLPQFRVSGSNLVDGSKGAADGDSKGSTLMRFDIEDGDERPEIPGLSDAKDSSGVSGGGAGGDWESDSESEDDLQIVLNDSNNNGNGRGDIGGGYRGSGTPDIDDDGEGGDPLVIVADDRDVNQVPCKQAWGDEAVRVGNDEKDIEGKANGGVAASGAPVRGTVGFSGMGYHPFHSQFKYVRPGASSIPGTNAIAPVGVPGQARPPLNTGFMPGRGRSDWRLTGMRNATGLQKGFPSGLGMPPWGSGRGHGGLEFTLPSHKTIFEVDINNFEEKPWRYQGVDLTDFFNFGLNEESWKDYCKKLEQLRMETTMQSKIHVYESGRTEQGFDPDLPPELAAATGVRVDSTEYAINGKLGAGCDLKAYIPMRPALPTGRPIQVETGYSERVPSIDSRPPRIRDSDTIIEIACQDSADDNSSSCGVPESPDNGHTSEDPGEQQIAEDRVAEEDLGNTNHTSDSLTSIERHTPQISPTTRNIQNETSERKKDSPHNHERSPLRHRAARKHSKDVNDAIVERPMNEDSLQMCPSPTAENNDSLEGRAKQKNDKVDDDSAGVEIPEERSIAFEGKPSSGVRTSELETEKIASDSPGTIEKSKSGEENSSSRTRQEFEDVGDADAARSSENSKARSSSRETYKWHDHNDLEVVQDSISTQRVTRVIPDDQELGSRRRDLGRRREKERSHLSAKPRMDTHQQDKESGSVHTWHIERQKERDYSDGTWRRREDEFSSERHRIEDSRKRDRGDELGSKDRSRGCENERGDKKERLPSKRQSDNGFDKVNHEKDASRRKQREASLGSRYENLDDCQNKRKKAGDFVGRESDKEELLRQSRESSSHQKRETDISIDQRQRDEQHGSRKGLEEHHSSRLKDGNSLLREKNDQSRDRDERHKMRQNHEGHLVKREREDDRAGLRAGHVVEEISRTGKQRTRDSHKGPKKEYHHKDAGRQSEQARKRERVEERPSSHRQSSTEDRRSRQEKPSRDLVSNNSLTYNRKHQEGFRKTKESEIVDHLSSRRPWDDRIHKADNMGMKGPAEQQSKDPAASKQICSFREKRKETVTSEDEHSDSRRGRSKFECWTSHNERDDDIKPSSPSRFENSERNMKSATSETDKLREPVKTSDAANKVLLLAEGKDTVDAKKKDIEIQPLDNNKHIDTTEKLKKRSERFKLPMPSENEAPSIKKVENEPLPSSKSGMQADSEIKPERPVSKRRWASD